MLAHLLSSTRHFAPMSSKLLSSQQQQPATLVLTPSRPQPQRHTRPNFLSVSSSNLTAHASLSFHCCHHDNAFLACSPTVASSCQAYNAVKHFSYLAHDLRLPY